MGDARLGGEVSTFSYGASPQCFSNANVDSSCDNRHTTTRTLRDQGSVPLKNILAEIDGQTARLFTFAQPAMQCTQSQSQPKTRLDQKRTIPSPVRGA